MNERIKQLEKEIEAEKRKMSLCFHVFGKPYRDDKTEKEPYGYRSESQGSDVWAMPEGYRTKIVPRWARVCEKCGKVEYTEKTEAVEVKHEPKF